MKAEDLKPSMNTTCTRVQQEVIVNENAACLLRRSLHLVSGYLER